MVRRSPEKDFQDTVLKWAKLFNWRCFYIPDWMYRLAIASMMRKRRADRDWPDKGFPDLVLIKPGHLILAELKADNGTVSKEQKQWHALFASVGLTVHVWKPKDIDRIILLLSST
jgi:hypothetical protein